MCERDLWNSIKEEMNSALDVARRAIRQAEIRQEILDKLEKRKVPELLEGLKKGELVVVKKEEAVCPVCGYEFQSKFSERKTC